MRSTGLPFSARRGGPERDVQKQSGNRIRWPTSPVPQGREHRRAVQDRRRSNDLHLPPLLLFGTEQDPYQNRERRKEMCRGRQESFIFVFSASRWMGTARREGTARRWRLPGRERNRYGEWHNRNPAENGTKVMDSTRRKVGSGTFSQKSEKNT